MKALFVASFAAAFAFLGDVKKLEIRFQKLGFSSMTGVADCVDAETVAEAEALEVSPGFTAGPSAFANRRSGH